MSLTLDLAPGIEAALREEAEREGIEPAQFVTRLIEERVASPRQRLTPEEWLRKADAWAAGNRFPVLPDEAYERASFYDDDRL